MSSKNNRDSRQQQAIPFSEEFKIKVLKRGLELRNWSAASREFDLSLNTLRMWRGTYTSLLEQLAFEMGVEVYYNPKVEFETLKSRAMPILPCKDPRINLFLSTRILTPLESAALVLKKAKVPMTTQRIYQDILQLQLRNRIDFDDLKNDLLAHCGPDDPFSLMKSTTAFFNENSYAFRLKQNISTRRLLNSGYNSLKEDIKPSFLSTNSPIKTTQNNEQHEESDSLKCSSKGINLLVPNLCVKPISVAAGSDKRTSPDPVSINCHQIYIRENSLPIVSPSLCKETVPSPVKYLLASDKRRIGGKKHRGVSGEEFLLPLNLGIGEDAKEDKKSNVQEVPITSATSSMIIERQSDSLNLNTPCVLLTNNDTGQLYHVATHPDQLIHPQICIPSSCTDRAEMPSIVSDLGSSTIGIASADTNSRHMVCDIQSIKQENQKKTASRNKRRKNGMTSPVTHFLMEKDIKNIINKKNFSLYFSEEERNELISLLPEIDQVVTPSEVSLSETAFSHEYFSQALTEWHEDVLCGEVNLNTKIKNEKNESLKKSDIWKVKQLHDYEQEEASKSNRLPSGVVSVSQLRLEVEQEKRSLSKSFDGSSLNNLFLHPSMLHTSVTQLAMCKPTQSEVRIQLNKSLLAILPLKSPALPDVIDLTLSDSDDSMLHTDDILFNKSSLVISLPRLPTDFESPSKKAHRTNNSIQRLTTELQSSKRLKMSQK
ncbi:hypothetical protein LOD99_14056 [Oopsacas minuta]|uniref:ASX DEUBAD domain-containing protein n=1 Tax=Oopsacas minuta TaxID=111878 RepID=A0AAV7KGD8_9METZ|nr:hypothetical protein LOD99_14056 [Oopsacas minuta]